MDYNAPGNMMGQQLAGIINADVQERRAQAYAANEQRTQIAKNFEVKATLAKNLMAVDPAKALEMMNDGLSGFGVSLTMEQFNPAIKGFETMGELVKAGDHKGAQMVLRSMKESGWLINLQDQQKAAGLEAETNKALASQQAEAVARIQHPGVSEAQQRVNAWRGVQTGEVDPTEISRLYGTQDPTEQQHIFARDEAIVQGFEAQATMRADTARAFTLVPGLGEKALSEATTKAFDPTVNAKVRIKQLLEQPSRTEAQDRELMALAYTNGSESLQTALGAQNAATRARTLQQDLDETTNRADSLTKIVGVLDTASGSIAKQQADRSLLPPTDSTLPLDQADKAAAHHQIYTDRLKTEYDIFTKQTEPVKTQTLQQAQQNRARANELSKQLIAALPGQKEDLTRRRDEALRVAESSEALGRLLGHENPYTIATQEAEIAQMPDSKEKGEAQNALDALKAARSKDLAMVGAEQERVNQRKRALNAGRDKADREADEERKIGDAAASVVNGQRKGLSMTTLMRDATKEFGVPAAKLFKVVQEYQGLGVIDAQNEFAMLPPERQTPQSAGAIGKKYGVKAQDVMEGIKNPNKPLVEINQNAPGERRDIAEGRSQLDMLNRIEMLYSPDYVGPIDSRLGKMKSWSNTIKEKEAEFRSASKLLRTELRKFYFGAAQSKQELDGALESIPDIDNMSDKQFEASIKQTKLNVQSMLSRRGEVMEQSGVRNPKQKPMDERFNELKATGKSKEEIFKILQGEGY